MASPTASPPAGPASRGEDGQSSHLPPPRAVLFDHDGTIVDSLAVVVAATNETLVARGHPAAAPADVVAAMVLPTGPRMGFHACEPDPLRQQCLAKDFYQAAHRHRHLARAYDGVPDLLAALIARGIPCGVVTNNQGSFVRGVADRLGLAPHLTVVVGEEDMPAPKPDPRGAYAAAAACGCRPDECWFVGDAQPDALVAAAAGMIAIGVTWGTHRRAQLADIGFACLVDHPHEILRLVDTATSPSA